jgi:hypothetical protein
MFTGSPTGYNAEFERLRTEIKKLEKSQKKHKQRELRMHQQMMDTQQQLEYLIQSRSYESNRPCSYHNHESSTWNQYMNRNTNDTTTKATNSSSSNYQFTPSQHKQDPYWYNSYGGYYYMNETPYHHQSYGGYLSSSEPEDYYQEQNEYDRNMATSLPTNFTSSIAIPISKYYNRNSKSLDNYYPSYYSSSALATENERNYYFQPHSQMYPYDYSQHNEDINNTNSRATVIPKNNSKNKKRWTQ